MSRYHCDDCDHSFDAPTDTETCRCGCGERAWREEATNAIRPTRTEIAEQARVVRAAGDDVDALLAAEPSAPADQNLRDRIAQVLLTTPREGWTYTAGQEKWDHHKHGDRPGHNYAIYCALCTNDVDLLADAVLAVLPTPADEAPPLLAEVWTVWREDEPVWGHFATEDTGKTGTIDYYEEQEERCPDYGWRQDGPRLELLAGGETTGIYLSRHPVYGKPAPADRATVLNEAADAVAMDRDSSLPGSGKGAWRRGMTRAETLLRRMADETQQAGEGR